MMRKTHTSPDLPHVATTDMPITQLDITGLKQIASILAADGYFAAAVAAHLEVQAVDARTTQPRVLTRIIGALVRTFDALDPSERATVERMDDDGEAALYLLARTGAAGVRSAAGQTVAAFDARRALERDAGGFVGASELKSRTGYSRQTILDWSNAHRLLAIDDNGRRRYPLCQFDDKGQIVPGLDRVLAALAQKDIESWMALDFLLAQDPATKTPPIELLRSGRVDEAVDAAAAYGEQGAA
jgi:hypothetical protein